MHLVLTLCHSWLGLRRSSVLSVEPNLLALRHTPGYERCLSRELLFIASENLRMFFGKLPPMPLGVRSYRIGVKTLDFTASKLWF